jgi:hypothetical protein
MESIIKPHALVRLVAHSSFLETSVIEVESVANSGHVGYVYLS